MTDRKPCTNSDALQHSVEGNSEDASPYKALSYDPGPAAQLIARHRMPRYPYICQFGNAVLEIGQGVFCPTLSHASPLLLKSVAFQPGQRVLDAFAGSAAIGINAALQGAKVVSVDISAAAAACAAHNAVLNGVQENIQVRCGTLAETVQPGETFDIVAANPPLLPGEQADELSTAIFDPAFSATVDFLDRLGTYLSDYGHGYLVTSDVIDRCGFDVDRICFEHGLASAVIEKFDAGYEVYRVHQIVRDRIGVYQ
jgi:methylase of polypeptide subunit release factors